MIYYTILIGLFVIVYGVFIYSLCRISKQADEKAEQLFNEMRKNNESKSDI